MGHNFHFKRMLITGLGQQTLDLMRDKRILIFIIYRWKDYLNSFMKMPKRKLTKLKEKKSQGWLFFTLQIAKKYFPRQIRKKILFVSNQVTQYFSCQVFLLSSIYLTLKVFFKEFYVENIVQFTQELYHTTLIELDSNVKFPLLRLLHFPSDLKMTIPL